MREDENYGDWVWGDWGHVCSPLAKGNQLILCDPHAEKRETLAAELHVKATGDIAFAVRERNSSCSRVKPGDLLGVAKAVEGEVLSGQKWVTGPRGSRLTSV